MRNSLKKLLDDEHWYPLVHPTNVELVVSENYNRFLDALGKLTDEEVTTAIAMQWRLLELLLEKVQKT